ELLVIEFAFARQLRAQTSDRIVEPIFLQLVFGSITRRIGHRMTAITIRPGLDKRRMRIPPDGSNDVAETVAHFAEIHSVHDFARNVITLGAIDDLLE